MFTFYVPSLEAELVPAGHMPAFVGHVIGLFLEEADLESAIRRCEGTWFIPFEIASSPIRRN